MSIADLKCASPEQEKLKQRAIKKGVDVGTKARIYDMETISTITGFFFQVNHETGRQELWANICRPGASESWNVLSKSLSVVEEHIQTSLFEEEN